MMYDEAIEVIGCSYASLRKYVLKGKIRTSRYQVKGRYGKLNYWDEDVYALADKRKGKSNMTVGYVRVSHDAESDLNKLGSQIDEMRSFCTSNGISLDEIYEDIGLSTDYSATGRPNFHRLLLDIMKGRINLIVIDTKCRISRVGFELFETLCRHYGTSIRIMNPVISDSYYLSEQTDDLTRLIEDAGLARRIIQ